MATENTGYSIASTLAGGDPPVLPAGSFNAQTGSEYNPQPDKTQGVSAVPPPSSAPRPSQGPVKAIPSEKFNGKMWLRDKFAEVLRPYPGESASIASARVRKWMDLNKRVEGLQDISQDDAEHLFDQWYSETMPKSDTSGYDTQEQDLLKQIYAPQKGLSDVHAQLKDINPAQGAAGITMAILNALHHGNGMITAEALGAPLNEAQNRLIAKRKEDISNEQARREGLAQEFGLVKQAKARAEGQFDEATQQWEKRVNTIQDPGTKMAKLQLDRYSADTRRLAEVNRLIEHPETLKDPSEYADYKLEQYRLMHPSEPITQEMYDGWVAQGKNPSLKEKNINQTMTARGKTMALTDERFKDLQNRVQWRDKEMPVKIANQRKTGLLDDKKIRQMDLMYKWLPAKERDEATERGLKIAAARNRINAGGLWTDENGKPVSASQARAQANFEGSFIHAQAQQFQSQLGMDPTAYNTFSQAIRGFRKSGLKPEEIKGLIAASMPFGGDVKPEDVDQMIDLQEQYDDNQKFKSDIVKRAKPEATIKGRRGSASTFADPDFSNPGGARQEVLARVKAHPDRAEYYKKWFEDNYGQKW